MIRRTLLASIFVASGFAGGVVLSGRFHSAEEAGAEPRRTPDRAAAPVEQTAQAQTTAFQATALPDLSSVASRAIPSVMNITSLQVVRQNSPFDSDPMFRYFFGDRDNMLG